MTQLLISVKNVEEALLTRYAGVDIIDLKDPSVGALGALGAPIVTDIVREVESSALLSATVGEGHENVPALVNDILLYSRLGVSVIKVAVSDLFHQSLFEAELLKLTKQGIKLVAVFFADGRPDLSLVPKLQKCGFYGAMMDTQFKQKSLLDVQAHDDLQAFVERCEKHGLISGLAGSVNKSHLDILFTFKPSFIGLRGGVCGGKGRASALVYEKVLEVKDVLLNYNKH